MPVLWDKKTETIVNNESSEIIRMFNTVFNDQLPQDKAAIDIYPERLRAQIDEVNEWVYDTVNSAYSAHTTVITYPQTPEVRIRAYIHVLINSFSAWDV